MKFYVLKSLKEARPHAKAKVDDIDVFELDEKTVEQQLEAQNVEVLGEFNDKLSAQSKLAELLDTAGQQKRKKNSRSRGTGTVHETE